MSTCPDGDVTDDGRWKYDGEGFGSLHTEHLHAEFPRGDIPLRMYPASSGTVSFGATLDIEGLEAGLLIKLSPEEAEAFATDLLECAAGAREMPEDEPLDPTDSDT